MQRIKEVIIIRTVDSDGSTFRAIMDALWNKRAVFKAWETENRYGTTAVEDTVWRLRQKLEDDPKHPIYINMAVRSGYKIEVSK